MIDIYLAREIGRGERQSPAIPEDVEIAIGNNDATSPYIVCLRKRMLRCGASAGEQSVLAFGILRKYGIHQIRHIITNSCPLAASRCIVNANAHANNLAPPIMLT